MQTLQFDDKELIAQERSGTCRAPRRYYKRSYPTDGTRKSVARYIVRVDDIRVEILN